MPQPETQNNTLGLSTSPSKRATMPLHCHRVCPGKPLSGHCNCNRMAQCPRSHHCRLKYEALERALRLLPGCGATPHTSPACLKYEALERALRLLPVFVVAGQGQPQCLRALPNQYLMAARQPSQHPVPADTAPHRSHAKACSVHAADRKD